MQTTPATITTPLHKSPFSDTSYAYSSTAGTDAVALSESGHTHSLPPQTAASQRQAARICGVRRNTFYIILAIGSFLLVLGIAAGVGLGLALNHPTPR